jgi:hypothetical protein
VTLGGGAGWLNGKYGLASDNLISADVVTADGRVVVASDHDHPDLFWALRGGGGNFGVVTSLEFRVHELGATVLAGLLLHPFARADEMLRMFRDVTASAPDELTVYAAVLTLSDGARFAALAVCYAGDLDEGERILTPLRLFGPPLADTIQPMPYRTWQGAFDSFFPTGRRNYWKSGMLRFIDDAAIEVIAAHARSLSSPHSVVLIEHFHGACSNAVAPDTAWPHRHLPYHLLVLSQWIDPAQDQAHIDWTRAFHRQLQPHLDTGVCLNALSADEGDDRIRAAYGASYDRLAAVKRTWDPGNVFHAIPSITPANLEPEAHTGGIPALGA